MSLASWEKEYYEEYTPGDGLQECLRKSLKKWLGLKAQALEDHGLAYSSVVHRSLKYITLVCRGHNTPGDAVFNIDSSTCALCDRVTDYEHEVHPNCDLCPLRSCDGGNNPFMDYARKGDPEPMIEKLIVEQRKD